MITLRTLRFAGLFLLMLGGAYAQAIGRDYGRSMVISQQGIAATSQVLASQAGAQILARGGSAVDAAIAANAVLAVTEPMMTGLGGDLFVMYWDAKTGKADRAECVRASAHAVCRPSFSRSKESSACRDDGIHSRHGSGRGAGLVRKCTSASASFPGKICSKPPSHMRSKVSRCTRAIQ